MSREGALHEVRRAVEATGLPLKVFAEQAGLDPGTLGDYLNGKRKAQAPTRRKIEHALGWEPGRILDLERDPDPGPVAEALEEAILADTRLLPEARAHLLNQLELLLRLQAATPPGFLEQQERRRQEAQAEADRSLERQEAVEQTQPSPLSRLSQKSGRKAPPLS